MLFFHAREKRVYTTTVAPLLSRSLSPDPEVTEQKKLWCILFSWENKGKGYTHHRSGKKGIHHRASDPEKEKKEGLHGGGVYFFAAHLSWWAILRL